jgi:hypothetical protein
MPEVYILSALFGMDFGRCGHSSWRCWRLLVRRARAKGGMLLE